MPHVNHRRGETSRFVFRREHGRCTHFTYHKGKSESWKPFKKVYNRMWRATLMHALIKDAEDPVPSKHQPRLQWILT